MKTQEESRLFWKLWQWYDFWYFLNYAKPLYTLDFFCLAFLHWYMNLFAYVGVVGAWLSVSSVQTGKQSNLYFIFLLLIY